MHEHALDGHEGRVQEVRAHRSYVTQRYVLRLAGVDEEGVDRRTVVQHLHHLGTVPPVT